MHPIGTDNITMSRLWVQRRQSSTQAQGEPLDGGTSLEKFKEVSNLHFWAFFWALSGVREVFLGIFLIFLRFERVFFGNFSDLSQVGEQRVFGIFMIFLRCERGFLGIFLRCERSLRDKCSIASLDAAWYGGGSDGEKGDIITFFNLKKLTFKKIKDGYNWQLPVWFRTMMT